MQAPPSAKLAKLAHTFSNRELTGTYIGYCHQSSRESVPGLSNRPLLPSVRAVLPASCSCRCACGTHPASTLITFYIRWLDFASQVQSDLAITDAKICGFLPAQRGSGIVSLSQRRGKNCVGKAGYIVHVPDKKKLGVPDPAALLRQNHVISTTALWILM
jgi:hypothetical protein